MNGRDDGPRWRLELGERASAAALVLFLVAVAAAGACVDRALLR